MKFVLYKKYNTGPNKNIRLVSSSLLNESRLSVAVTGVGRLFQSLIVFGQKNSFLMLVLQDGIWKYWALVCLESLSGGNNLLPALIFTSTFATLYTATPL